MYEVLLIIAVIIITLFGILKAQACATSLSEGKTPEIKFLRAVKAQLF
jgi:hypothetical protein